jgi:HD-GYP domain-containing protein (c-di-GMP phosphodiesterase class II)
MVIDKKSLRGIIQIDSELNTIQDVDILLQRILYEARRVVNADAGSIYVKEGDKLSIKYSQNDTKQKELQPGEKLIYNIFSMDINEKTVSGYAAMTGKLINLPDVYNLPPGTPFSPPTSYDRISGYKSVSMLTIPLKTSAGAILGVIQVINARDKKGQIVPFHEDDEMYVTHFAANASVTLQRAWMTRAMILRMIKMSELRDPKETGAHVNRVAGIALEIYERWAYKHEVDAAQLEKTRDSLKLAAMLHDVGKVAISDLILKKPARFTDEEYKIMQGHTYFGAKLFGDPQSDFDQMAKDTALTHHENWDGTGYPGYIDTDTGAPLKTDSEGNVLKRKGEEIPLAGRIVAIADVYDALTSKRVYKESWEEDRVYTEIRSGANKKFDPEIVDIFFQVLPNIQQVRRLYPEAE